MVSFTFTPTVAKSYQVMVNGLRGSFIATPTPPVEPLPGEVWIEGIPQPVYPSPEAYVTGELRINGKIATPKMIFTTTDWRNDTICGYDGRYSLYLHPNRTYTVQVGTGFDRWWAPNFTPQRGTNIFNIYLTDKDQYMRNGILIK